MCYPANYPQVIAVVAMDRADFVIGYSSQGRMISGEMKPDLAATGGYILTTGGVWSSDSNDGNIPLAWGYDRIADDGTAPQGTSLATPIAAGAAQLVIDALSGWDWVEDNAAGKAPE